jgi:hypothetical protein
MDLASGLTAPGGSRHHQRRLSMTTTKSGAEMIDEMTLDAALADLPEDIKITIKRLGEEIERQGEEIKLLGEEIEAWQKSDRKRLPA